MRSPVGGHTQERRFNPWRTARTAAARALVSEVVAIVEDHETRAGLRKRARKAADRDTMLATLDAVVSDLAYHHAGSRDGGLYLSRSKAVLSQRSRYRPPFYGKALPQLLDLLACERVAILRQELGGRHVLGEGTIPARTVVRPGARLAALLDSYGLLESDFGESAGSDPIVLKRELTGFWDEGGAIEYDDTTETDRLRAEMREINAWLAAADLDFADPFGVAPPVDIQDRSLRRIFTRGRFDSGGRLYGGFWQGMSAERRLRSLVIKGETAVELDFGQLGPRVLYGLAGAELPPGDLYGVPGLERHRQGVKRFMSAMTFHAGALGRFPRGVRKLFPKDAKAAEIAAAIADHHRPLAPFFGTEIGHHVQHVESRIVVSLLLALRAEGIVGLPIHDALLVPESAAERVRALMLDTFHHHARVPGCVSVKVG